MMFDKRQVCIDWLFRISLWLSIVLLQACGSGDDEPDKPPRIDQFKITGVVHDSPVNKAKVVAYDFSQGRKGRQLGEDESDDNGQFSIDIELVKDVPVLLEASGGTYIDEVTGQTITLSSQQTLTSLFNYQNTDQEIQITALTTWASCLANYYLADEPLTITEAINRSEQEISQFFGLSSIHAIRPANILSSEFSSETFNENLHYGYVLASLSGVVDELAERSGQSSGVHPYTSVQFIQLGCVDIQDDGLLDGDASFFLLS